MQDRWRLGAILEHSQSRHTVMKGRCVRLPVLEAVLAANSLNSKE